MLLGIASIESTTVCVSAAVKGLGLIPGTVGRFDSSNGFSVPHIGWNALQVRINSEILEDIIGNRHVYFVHSYRAMPVHFFFAFYYFGCCFVHCWPLLE